MPQQDFKWAPNTYYKLRDTRMAGRIAAVEGGGLTGEVFPRSKVHWINLEPFVDAAHAEAAAWDLEGNSKGERSYDLMERMN